MLGSELPARAGHHLQGPQAGQRPPRPRGSHQAHRLRDVQGGNQTWGHNLNLLWNSELYCAGDPEGRGLQVQVGMASQIFYH